MRGGDRYGAGRPASHNKAESFRSIDVRRWAREGKLRQGNYFGWRWTLGEEEVGSIGVHVESSYSLTLKYSCSVDGGERQSVSFPITLTYTTCPFGGERVWFICPHSGRRVAKLYSYRGRWYCRKALRLTYQSQSDDFMTRMHRGIERLESKLWIENFKPKGMHWTTYNRIMEKRDRYEERLDCAFMQRIAPLLGNHYPPFPIG